MAFAKAEALTMVCMKNRFWTLIALNPQSIETQWVAGFLFAFFALLIGRTARLIFQKNLTNQEC